MSWYVANYHHSIPYTVISILNYFSKIGEDGKLIYRCVCCPIYFETVEVVQAHQKEAHMTKLTCNICSKTFKDPESVGAHIRYVHTKVNSSVEKKKYTYVCTKCGTAHFYVHVQSIRLEKKNKIKINILTSTQVKNSIHGLHFRIMKEATADDHRFINATTVISFIIALVR